MFLLELLNLTYAEVFAFPRSSEKPRDILIRLPFVSVCMLPMALC
jgi:hypothetical protein